MHTNDDYLNSYLNVVIRFDRWCILARKYSSSKCELKL